MKGLSQNIDPRVFYIRDKYREFKILAFASSKGGVGKTTLATISALYLAKEGYVPGLLDLDIYGPTTHVILDVAYDSYPVEEDGVKPVSVKGIKYMSLVYYSKNKALSLRGNQVKDALRELLTIINWGKLDLLIIDMPPGMGDILIEVSELLPVNYVVITTPSKLSIESVKKLMEFLGRWELPAAGLIENMKSDTQEDVQRLAQEYGIPYLGSVPFSHALMQDRYEAAIETQEIAEALNRIWLTLKEKYLQK